MTTVLAFTTQVLSGIVPLIRAAWIMMDYSPIIIDVSVRYLLRILQNFPNFATPIVAIYYLRPVRLAMKKSLKKILCKHNEVTPVPGQ